MKKQYKILLIIAIIVMALVVCALGYGYYKKITEKVQNPIVTMEVEGFGNVKIELYPDMAPNTVAHIVKTIKDGFYDGLTFHRIVPGFMIQGGDIDGTGQGELDYTIPGEFIANGFTKNTLKHERGVISMARADYSSYGSGLSSYSYNSAATQFFIMTDTTPQLDGYYTPFGKVIEGMEVVDAIANEKVIYRSEDLKSDEEAPKDEEGKTISPDRPVNPPVITKMTVETFGVDYGEAVKLEPFDYYAWFKDTYGYDIKSLYGIE